MIGIVGVESSGWGRWVVAWEDGHGAVDVWLEGRMLAEGVTGTSLEVLWLGAGDPPVEVVPTGETATSQFLRGRVELMFRGDLGAERYLVQRWVDGEWVTRDTVAETGSGYYTWYGMELVEDGEEVVYRVVAERGGAGVSLLEHRLEVVRFPVWESVGVVAEKDEETGVVELVFDAAE